MPDVAELGRRVQQKYPGAYDDLDPAEIGRRVKLKHPGAYDDFADVAAPVSGIPDTSQAPAALPPQVEQPSRATLRSASGLPSPEQVDASATGAAQAVLEGVREMSQQIAGSLAPPPGQVGQRMQSQLAQRAAGDVLSSRPKFSEGVEVAPAERGREVMERATLARGGSVMKRQPTTLEKVSGMARSVKDAVFSPIDPETGMPNADVAGVGAVLKGARSAATKKAALKAAARVAKKSVLRGPKIKQEDGILRTVKKHLQPAETSIGKQKGGGAQLKKLLDEQRVQGEIASGKRLSKLGEAKLGTLSREQRFELLDALEGRAKATDPAVRKAAAVAKQLSRGTVAESKAAGVLTRERVVFEPATLAPGQRPTLNTAKRVVKLNPGDPLPTGITSKQRDLLRDGKRTAATIKRPFEAMKNHFPHQIASSEQLQNGPMRADVIENIVRQKIKPTKEAAASFVDDYRRYLDTGEKQQSLIDYMVQTGQAKTDAEAFKNLQLFRRRTIKRAGSLEYAREVNLPFYNPNPAQVLPTSIQAQSTRLAQIKLLGQENQNVNTLVKGIRDAGGDADFARKATDRILGMVNEADTGAAKFSQFVRTMQGFKLGLASIPNSSQGALNTMLAADFRAVAAGLKGVMTAKGRRLALESGATLEATLSETLRHAGAGGDRPLGRALGRFLKATGFSATERLNRTYAANAGADYAGRMLGRLKKNPTDGRALKVLSEMGFDPAQLLRQGRLEGDDVLRAANKFSNLTQFRSGPQDLPLFASSEGGKVFFQFKNFIYGQTRLIHRELIQEARAGRYGRAARAALILGTVFPMTGMAIRELREVAKGQQPRDEGPLKQWIEGAGQVGAAGVLADIIESGAYKRGSSFLLGPTGSDVAEVIDLAGGAVAGQKFTPSKKRQLLRKLPFGSVVAPRLLPPEQKSARSSSRSKLRGSAAERIRAKRKQRLRGSR